MPSYSLNNVTAPDIYLAAGQAGVNGVGAAVGPATLAFLPILDHINIDVVNGAIYFSLQQTNRLSSPNSGTFQPETFMAPGSRTITRVGVVGIRIRAAVLAVNLQPTSPGQAQVTVEAVES